MKLSFTSKLTLTTLVAVLFTAKTFAQGNVGIGTTNPHQSAQLDITATDKGLLIPRVALVHQDSPDPIVKPANGLIVYNTNPDMGKGFGVGPYYNQGNEDNPLWVKFIQIDDLPLAPNAWVLEGNVIPDENSFLGTTNNNDLIFKSRNIEGLRIGKGGTLLAGNYSDVIEDFVPTSSSGIKLMWLPAWYAFRAGQVTGDQWNANNIGKGSFAVGMNTIAAGLSSFAGGSGSAALGNHSTAIGFNNTAGTLYSIAIGAGNKINQGINNIALGTFNIADATGAIALGYANISNNDYAAAIGNTDTASGPNSFATGNKTKAAGMYSVAMGASSKALADYAVALGNTDTANGLSAFATGVKTKAEGDASIAMGSESKALTDFAVAIGEKSQALSENSIAIGLSTLSDGTSSVAIGWGSKSHGLASTAMGYYTLADEGYTTALGTSSKALKQFATAIGSNATASGTRSVALGNYTTASGTASIALGNNTQAANDNTTAMGNITIASGYGATATGIKNTAYYYGSFVVGVNNEKIGGMVDANTPNSTDRIFEVANGNLNDNIGSNAVTVLRNGNVGINVANPSSRLHIRGAINVNDNDWSQFIYMDGLAGEGTVAIRSSAPAKAMQFKVFTPGFGYDFINSNNQKIARIASTGDMTLTGYICATAYNCPSDMRLKENIEPLQSVLTKINNIQPISYYFKDKKAYAATHQIGFSAQEIAKEFPELATTTENGYLAVNYPQMTAVAIQAIKEQQTIIEKQEKKIELQRLTNEELKIKNEELGKRIERLEKILIQSSLKN